MKFSSDFKNFIIKKPLLILSLISYGLSLLLGGINHLLLGILGALLLNFAWFANISYFIAIFLVLSQKYRTSFIFAVISVVVSLQSFQEVEMWDGSIQGGYSMLTSPSFIFWEISFILLFVHSYLNYKYPRIK